MSGGPVNKIERLRMFRERLKHAATPQLTIKGETYYVIGERITPEWIKEMQAEIDLQESAGGKDCGLVVELEPGPQCTSCYPACPACVSPPRPVDWADE